MKLFLTHEVFFNFNMTNKTNLKRSVSFNKNQQLQHTNVPVIEEKHNYKHHNLDFDS